MLGTKLKQLFTLDYRSLALFRICLALLLIGDITVRFSDVEAFYSNQGWLTLSFLHAGNFFSRHSMSLHAMNGTIWFQSMLFILAYVFAFAMLIGYRTKTATALCWVLLLSVQNRNILILQGGDDLLRLCLLWAIFLPTATVWSLDSQLKGEKLTTYRYFGAENIGYILLLFSLYFFSALMKHSAEWYTQGTALYYALSIDQMVYPLGRALYAYP